MHLLLLLALVILLAITLELYPKPTIPPYTQNDGFPVCAWGPSMWKIMHIAAANFPLDPSSLSPERVQGYMSFYDSLKHILPCKNCREHYKQFVESEGPLKLRPDIFTSRNSVFEWTVKLHDAVNARLHKTAVPARSPSDWYATYDSMRGGPKFFF